MAGAGYGGRGAGGRGRRLPEVLTEGELAALVRCANRGSPTGCRNLAMLLCMGRCGLRVGETLALRLQDVSADAIHVWQGKGGKDRTVPLDPQTAQAIEAWRGMRRGLSIRTHRLFVTITTRGAGEIEGLRSGPASAETEPGSPISQQYVRTMVARYARRAGLSKLVHPHTLRHTAATQWLRAGFDLRQVQQLLGHASPVTTQVYTHVFDEDLQRRQAALAPLPLGSGGRGPKGA